MIKNCLLW